ncbi:unnamed protein product [Rotaria sp. Silwood2]|nr:unnamed protein product [Rotaria sp. Silwood2]CAF2875204.1 unnamed protein product [Rotaria sp. Silwood2]CAF3245535.1 unnamed protein product [Rotaria sp. Silwood2]
MSCNTPSVSIGLTVAGGHGEGLALNQLSVPVSVFVDEDQTVYIADFGNHCIVAWKHNTASGQVVAGENGKGNENNQFSNPTDVIVDKETDMLLICDLNNCRVMRWPRHNGTSEEVILEKIACGRLAMDKQRFLYISDLEKNDVRRYRMGETNGTEVAGGNGVGDRLNQFNRPGYLFVNNEQSVYVSDSWNQCVMKWEKDAKEGIVAAGGHGQGNGLSQLYNPQGVVVDSSGTVYVADVYNHRVMYWPKEATQGTVLIGVNELGEGANQLNSPIPKQTKIFKNAFKRTNGNRDCELFTLIIKIPETPFFA